MTIGEEPARDRRAKPGAATAPDDGAGHDLSISLESRAGFTQIVDFDVPGLEPFVIDEPPPLGAGGARTRPGCSPPPSGGVSPRACS